MKTLTEQLKKRLLNRRGSILFIVLVVMTALIAIASSTFYLVGASESTFVSDFSSTQSYESASSLSNIVVSALKSSSSVYPNMVDAVDNLNAGDSITTANAGGSALSIGGIADDYTITISRTDDGSDSNERVYSILTEVTNDGKTETIEKIIRVSLTTTEGNAIGCVFDKTFAATGYSTADSYFATKKINSKVYFDQEYAVLDAKEGMDVTADVACSGTLTLKYQWFKPTSETGPLFMSVGNDLIVNGSNVSVNLSPDASSANRGKIRIGGDLVWKDGKINENASKPTNVYVLGDLYLTANNAYIGGDLYVNGDIYLSNNLKVEGNIYCNGHIYARNAIVNGVTYSGELGKDELDKLYYNKNIYPTIEALKTAANQNIDSGKAQEVDGEPWKQDRTNYDVKDSGPTGSNGTSTLEILNDTLYAVEYKTWDVDTATFDEYVKYDDTNADHAGLTRYKQTETYLTAANGAYVYYDEEYVKYKSTESSYAGLDRLRKIVEYTEDSNGEWVLNPEYNGYRINFTSNTNESATALITENADGSISGGNASHCVIDKSGTIEDITGAGQFQRYIEIETGDYQYEVERNADGSVKTDGDGNAIYKTNAKGDKIPVVIYLHLKANIDSDGDGALDTFSWRGRDGANDIIDSGTGYVTGYGNKIYADGEKGICIVVKGNGAVVFDIESDVKYQGGDFESILHESLYKLITDKTEVDYSYDTKSIADNAYNKISEPANDVYYTSQVKDADGKVIHEKFAIKGNEYKNNIFIVSTDKHADISLSARKNLICGFLYAPYMSYIDYDTTDTNLAMFGGLLVADYMIYNQRWYLCCVPDDDYIKSLMGDGVVLNPISTKSWKTVGTNN